MLGQTMVAALLFDGFGTFIIAALMGLAYHWNGGRDEPEDKP